MYTDIDESLNKLEDAQAGKLFKQIITYVNNREVIDTGDPLVDLLFCITKKQLDRDSVKYEKIIEKRRKAGLASANKRKQVPTHVNTSQQVSTNSTSVNTSQQMATHVDPNHPKDYLTDSYDQSNEPLQGNTCQHMLTHANTCEHMSTDNDNVNDNDSVNDNGNANENENENETTNVSFKKNHSDNFFTDRFLSFYHEYDYDVDPKGSFDEWQKLTVAEQQEAMKFIPTYHKHFDKRYRQHPKNYLAKKKMVR